MAYVRTVGTGSGAWAVQIVWSSRRGSRQVEHIGSAHDDGELAALQAAARERLAAGQQTLDLGLDQGGAPPAGGPLTILGSQAAHLWDALSRAYDALGFDRVAGADEAFRALVLARIVEPTSKFDSLRVPLPLRPSKASLAQAAAEAPRREQARQAIDGPLHPLSESGDVAE